MAAILAMSAKDAGRIEPYVSTFDTYSSVIGVDNRCSACISHEPSDFISELKPCDRSIKGFGGTRTQRVMQGTLVWKWCDDDGKRHRFVIPNSYYVPDGGCRLLSPQNWAKTQNDKAKHGTGEFTDAKSCTMYWKNRKYKLTMPLSKNTNVANIHMAPGY